MSLKKEDDIARISGWLHKKRRVMGVKTPRYFKLTGQILSSHPTEYSGATWKQNILHANVRGMLLDRRIVITSPERTITLYAESNEQYHEWLDCVLRSARRRIEDRYVFGETLGSGAFGKVVLAVDRESHKRVAVKHILKRSMQDENAKIWREINVMRSIKHKNIVATVGVYENMYKLHIVMEYMPGGSLGDLFFKMNKLEEDDAKQMLKDILEGVAYLQEMKVAHRDLKLANILCVGKTLPCQVKIGDFGLANFVGVSALSKDMLRSRVGSPHYVSPEVLTGGPYGVLVDCWAVGVIMCVLLTRSYPFYGQSICKTLQRVVGGDIGLHEECWTDISGDAKHLVGRLLEKDAEKRITAADALKHHWFD